MNQDNKKPSKKVGKNDQKSVARRRLREARNGENRLGQAMEEEINRESGINDPQMEDDYDDGSFIEKEEGDECDYGDEEADEELGLGKKTAKQESMPIMNYISNMANANNQIKAKQTLKPIENSEKFMKSLLEDFDEEEEMTKKTINSNSANKSIGGYNFNNNLSSGNKPFGLNPNFLPEFEKKLTTKSGDSNNKNNSNIKDNDNNSDIIMEVPFETSFNPESSNKKESLLIGREINKSNNNINTNQSKRTREELIKTNNNINSSTKSIPEMTTSDNIFQVRTPNTTNKTTTNLNINSNQTQYYTPNSHIPEVTGRTMNNIDQNVTPIRNLNPEMRVINNSASQNNTVDNNTEINVSMRNTNKEKIPTQQDGSLKVYWYDAIEDQVQSKPTVIFFGKVYEPTTKTYSSISMVIKNVMRSLYIYPKVGTDMFQVYKEFETLRSTKFSYIKDYVSKTVKKKYCFELPIPHGEHEMIKIKYSADMGTIPSNLKGETFEYIFGRNTSLLEKILLSRKVKGPCWLNIKKFDQPTSIRYTFCKHEVILTDYKFFEVDPEPMPNPPLKLMSISIKSVMNNGTNEIFAISAAMKDNYYIENEKGNNNINDFTPLVIMRKFEQNLFNKDDNSINLKLNDYDVYKEKFGHQNFLVGQNETAIINQFINKIHIFDPDIIIGHNLYTGQMELFFNRITRLKINHWAKIGKFRRDVLPKFLQNSNLGSFYVRSCMVGRLICDTFLSCRDILRESNYNLAFLSEKHMKEHLAELDPNILLAASKPDTIIKDLDLLLENSVREAMLTMLLMDKLAILPLTKQLTNIAGNLWIKSLQNSRADRCEMFLMHEFNKNKFIIPDKVNKMEKIEDNINDDKEDENIPGKKKPQYSGGLVLEPKIGLYDTIVLLLDFNSLYPTIIQEFNICFTTVTRKSTQNFNYFDNNKKSKKSIEKDANELDNLENNEDDELDVTKKVIPGRDKAILPLLLESLVQKRKVIKDLIKKEKDKHKLSMLDIKQKAIKLSANSLYGYLGYQNSRFYAKSIAALVTATGRNILQDTVNLVTNTLNLQIIYGDTDSIMINTNRTDIKEALDLGVKVKKSVKEKYKLLEMEIDGVFKTLLLLKKKKYAYLKYEPPYDKNSSLVSEYKGLDLVRRDWCDISKQTGFYILTIILSDKSKEEIVPLIIEFLKEIGEKMSNYKFELADYEITKQLTKNVEDYADAKALPHVKVAKRLKEKGDITIKQNSYIPYVVCKENINDVPGNPSNSSKSLADRCYHSRELLDNPNLNLDIDWYKENQIISSVSRLCKHIEEIDMFQLATALGIDASKYSYTLNKNKDGAEGELQVHIENDSVVKYFTKEGVVIKCKCGKDRTINKINDKTKYNLLQCDGCHEVSKDYGKLTNNLIFAAKKNIFNYFRGNKKCSKCDSVTRLFLRHKCIENNCSNGTYRKELSEYDASNEINFIKKLIESKPPLSQQNSSTYLNIQNNLRFIDRYIKDVNQKIEYNTVDLGELFSYININ